MANPTVNVTYKPLQPVGSHTSYSVSSATPITVPAGANALLIQATGQNVRLRLDGVAPTTGVGFHIRAGDPPVLLPVFPGMAVPIALQETATATLEVQAVSQPN